MTSVRNCSNLPGYGYQYGITRQCGIGFYNPGFDLGPCIECGEGLTTIASGATSMENCTALPGWRVASTGAAQPCPIGEAT